MATAHEIIPFSLKDAPSLIESVLPVQRISVDSYKEQMAVHGKTLTTLGSYWKGRKPLALNRACILASLLPATSNPKKDLAIFEMLMGMDDESLRKRLQLRDNTPLPQKTYRELAGEGKRAEEIWGTVHSHIWTEVNRHLGTSARNYPELIEQLGVMRFGRRPRVADTFSGSGQIPYEAARLGCDVYASDLNPVACMLTWGAFNIVGASGAKRQVIDAEQDRIIRSVRTSLDSLGVETDGKGWRARIFLYCLEVRCPSSGWLVPLLASRIISKKMKVIAELVPIAKEKRYEIVIKSGASEKAIKAAELGTYREESVIHTVDGVEHRTKISTIRGDFVAELEGKKSTNNNVRRWASTDVTFNDGDVYRERLYGIHWIRDDGTSRPATEFRSVSEDDLRREAIVLNYVKTNVKEWQAKGWVPDMRIEVGGPPRYQGKSLVLNFGWTHWQHLFNPRQLLIGALLREASSHGWSNVLLARLLNRNSRLCRWDPSVNAGSDVFYNQALNGLVSYASRGFTSLEDFLILKDSSGSNEVASNSIVENKEASQLDEVNDIYITDPPYGDAVKYEEIFDFFISWLRTNPCKDFESWVWDSRRAVAIKGEDHDFKLGMVGAYKRMAEKMPDNGLQVIMFTHQSGAIWADMANIVWASGLRVTAAWYVVTETDSALREGQYVKGTILLVLRKRLQEMDTARDELAYELAEEVKAQVDLLTGLNKDVKDLYRDENLFEDADLQMAGYAAALRVLTRYSQIDGVSMTQEAMRPRVKGQTTMVDELIAFAVNIANEYLVPEGVDRAVWEKSSGIERFYLKMLDMESKGIHVLSNYQNFAKAFKVQDYGAVMDEVKANHANLKSAAQLGKRGMTAGEEFGPTVLRSVLYAVHLLQDNKVKPEDVMHQLRDLVPDYFRERDRLTALADYVSKKTAKARPDESSNAMVLRDLVRRERV